MIYGNLLTIYLIFTAGPLSPAQQPVQHLVEKKHGHPEDKQNDEGQPPAKQGGRALVLVPSINGLVLIAGHAITMLPGLRQVLQNFFTILKF
jgi:uncharacterized protein (DUF2345 family)